MFRWEKAGESKLFGVDGANWYEVECDPHRLSIETNATREDFVSLFRLDESVEEYTTKILLIAPEMAPFVAAFPGLRVMKPSDAVEEAVCFLCTANNNLKRILGMVRHLSNMGAKMEGGREVHRIPELEQIASLPEERLRALGFGYRARTIPDIARQMVARGGREWLESLRKDKYPNAHVALMEINGIGPKLADCICLFALHHTEAVPVDTHLWQATVRNYFPQWGGKSLTQGRYQEIGDYYRSRFGKLAGWAHQYLFYDNMKNWRTYQKGNLDK